MKLSFFLKALSALSLMIALSVVVRSNAQQPVRAQTQHEVEADALSEVDCDAVLAAAEEGFSVFEGIELTPEQEAAYRRADAERSAEATAALETIPTEVDDSGINMVVKDGVTIPDDVLQEIIQAGNVANLDEVPDSEQVDELNAKYGQYVEFSLSERILYTPEDIAENEARQQRFINTVLSILTPEQQPIYLRNLETQRVIVDCLRLGPSAS